jgi:signal transduction histidine kinase
MQHDQHVNQDQGQAVTASQRPGIGPPSSSVREAFRSWHINWLALVRWAWVVVAILLLANFVASIPAYYTLLHTVCSLPAAQCGWRPTPANVVALAHLHLSVAGYAAYFISLDVVASLLFWIVGLLIFWRKSQQWMGVLFSLVLIITGSSGISDTLQGTFLPANAHAPYLLVFLLLLLNLIQWPLLGMFLLTFPTGRFAPRWSWMIVLLWIGQLGYFWLTNVVPFLSNLIPLVVLATYGSTFGIQVYRYVRVYDAVQRKQVKWCIYAFCIGLAIEIGSSVLGAVVAPLNAPDSWYQLLNGTFTVLLFVPIPLAIGIAIFRYHLWDIDIIINRTLVYGTLSASVICLYVLIVGYFGALFRTPNNPVISLIATALVAIVFQPLRSLLQRAVNRLMYGERDDPYAVLAHLGSRLEGTLVPEKVLPTIVETVSQALKLPYVAIALMPAQLSTSATAVDTTAPRHVVATPEADIVASYGTPTGNLVRIPLAYQAQTIGYLLLNPRPGDTFSKADDRLLSDLARQAGVAVYAVRLTSDLKQVNERLQQARERLVTTREEERRRLRRDLHDGLGPALASLTFKVDAARNLLAKDTTRVESLLDAVRQQAQEAISDIRRLVYDLRPPALDELGLLSALREQAAQYQHLGLQIDVDLPSNLPSLPAALEVAVYRIVQEALNNVSRHAGASHCLLHLSFEDDSLHLEICDDGKGIVPEHRIGIGLQAMRERASELGGTCTITTGSAGGTTIRVRFPLSTGRDSDRSNQSARPQGHALALTNDVYTNDQEE